MLQGAFNRSLRTAAAHRGARAAACMHRSLDGIWGRHPQLVVLRLLQHKAAAVQGGLYGFCKGLSVHCGQLELLSPAVAPVGRVGEAQPRQEGSKACTGARTGAGCSSNTSAQILQGAVRGLSMHRSRRTAAAHRGAWAAACAAGTQLAQFAHSWQCCRTAAATKQTLPHACAEDGVHEFLLHAHCSSMLVHAVQWHSSARSCICRCK